MAGNVARREHSFLFTDIEGSTRLWEEHPDAMLGVLARHDTLLRHAVSTHGGTTLKDTGDGIVAVFDQPEHALLAAVAAQRALAVEDWSAIGGLAVRMGVHRGQVVECDGEFHGWALNVASRLHTMAHGGQVVVSEPVVDGVMTADLDGAMFRDLGVYRLRDVAQSVRVLQVLADGLRADFPPLRGQGQRRRAIHRPANSFIGRDQDLQRLRDELASGHPVSVVGPPGVGKSRLALEAASMLEEGFEEGATLCDLSAVEPGGAANSIATQLGVQRRTGLTTAATLAGWMTEHRLLVVLDNADRHLDEVWPIVAALPVRPGGPNVVTTSRRPLSVPGEVVVRVAPLPSHHDDTGSHGPAVDLFLQRAAATGADVGRDQASLAKVAEICGFMNGLPLAIEIAASHASLLTLDELADLVSARPLESLGASEVVASLAWSVDQLPPSAADTLTRSTVFAGTFDLDAFTSVAGRDDTNNSLAALRELVDRSLVLSESHGGRSRFRILEPVRRLLRDRTTPEQGAEQRHAFIDHYVAFADRVSAELRGPGEKRLVRRLDLEFDNLRRAFDLALDPALEPLRVRDALRLAAALWDYGFMRMRTEVFDWNERAAEASKGFDFPERAMALGIASLGAWLRENPAKAWGFAEAALRLEQDDGRPRSLPTRLALVNLAQYDRDSRLDPQVFAELAELSHATASPYWIANLAVLDSLGASFAGRTERAVRLAARAVAEARGSQNPSTMAWTLFAAAVAAEPDDLEQAETLLSSSLDAARSVDNRWIEAMCMARMVSLRLRRASPLDAVAVLVPLIDIWERAGHRSHLWAAIRQSARCLAELGDDRGAVVLHQAASSAELHMPQLPEDDRALASAIDEVNARHPPGEIAGWKVEALGLDVAGAATFARLRLGALLSGGSDDDPR